jgi:predicted PhzF superfamily epimerase YddE/YHI9
LSSGEPLVEIVSEQGTRMGRQSFVHIRVETADGMPRNISVGGAVVPVVEGVLSLPE